MSRGLSNNNPGNIELSSDSWIGQVAGGTDSRFCQFSSMAYGYRAMFVLLSNYIDKGYNTISLIINHWAPPSENDTTAYIQRVVSLSGISATAVIDSSNGDSLTKLVSAISYQENGVPAVQSDVTDGYNLWQGITTATTVGISLSAVVLVSALGIITYNIIKKR